MVVRKLLIVDKDWIMKDNCSFAFLKLRFFSTVVESKAVEKKNNFKSKNAIFIIKYVWEK